MIDTDVARFRAAEDPVGLALTLIFDILWHLQYGSVDAIGTVPELLALSDQIGAPQLVAHASEVPGVVLWFQDDLDGSAVMLNKAAGIYQDIRNQQCAGHCLENIAGWAQRAGRAEAAAAILGSASALREDTGIPTPRYETFLFEQIREAIRDDLGDDVHAVWDRGLELSMESALEYAQEITSAVVR